MLTVNVKFIAGELTPGLVNGTYEIEDGATVRDVISMCENLHGVTVPEKNFRFMYPLFNGKPVTLDRAITVDGTLHLCRVVTGG